MTPSRCTEETDGRRTRARRLQRRIGKKQWRLAKERQYDGFAMRSNPLMLGPTREFPGVDIDAVHRNPRWMKKAA